GIDRAHLFAEPGEVGGEDRGRDEERTVHACLRRPPNMPGRQRQWTGHCCAVHVVDILQRSPGPLRPGRPGKDRRRTVMARTDVVVLGAGIIGVSIALHLAKRGLSVALLDRQAPGEGTSYGNAGVIEGNTIFPPPFPAPNALLKVALKQATEANYHMSFLLRIAPWLLQYRANST